MPTPEEEQLRALAEGIETLRLEQARLEERVRRLESQNGPRPEPPPLPVAYPAQIQVPPLPPPVFEPISVAPPRLPPLAESLSAPQDSPAGEPELETRFGLNWVNRLAVFTLLVGAAFLFKYGVENNWIGPGVRVMLGLISALVALAFGDRMFRREQKVFAQGLSGLGIALLYLSFWAAASFYGLVPNWLAFALMTATTAGAGWLALAYDSQAIAFLGLIGGYFTPAALSTGENRPWILFGYVLVLNAGALGLARVRPWRAIDYLALTGTVALYGGWAAEWYSGANRGAATIFAMAFYAEFLAARVQPLWMAIQFLTPLALVNMWSAQGEFLPFQVLLAAAGLTLAESRRWPMAPPWSALWFWAPFLVWHGTVDVSDSRGVIFGWLTLAFLLFFAWLPWWAIVRERTPRAVDLTTLAGNAAAYFASSYWLLNPAGREYMGLLAAGLGGLHLALAKALWKQEAAAEENRAAAGAAGLALVFVTLAVPIQFSGFRISIAWAIEGAFLAWAAARFGSRLLEAAARFVLLAVFLHLYAADAWIYNSTSSFSIIANARFLTFVAGSAALGAAARYFRQREARGLAYIAAHATLLFALAHELSSWVDRAFAEASAQNVFTLGLSILTALYAVMLVGIGAATRTFLNRWMGLALLAITVLKLYLLDVWQLGRGFRIAAFLGLGALLLAVSYLYSRFRLALRRLIKQDQAS
jgi:uncharacterized membrane protein